MSFRWCVTFTKLVLFRNYYTSVIRPFHEREDVEGWLTDNPEYSHGTIEIMVMPLETK